MQSEVFLPYITAQLQHVTQLDIIWDRYSSNGLKADTRSKTGNGVRQHVETSGTLPGNWQSFLQIDDNKTKFKLFTFLATRIANIVTSKHIISTYNANVLCTNQREVSRLSPCTHEETNTRIFLHLEDAIQQGHNMLSIHTVELML